MIGFSLGPKGVFFNLLPLNNQLLPERFLNFAAFGIPVAAAGLLPLGRRLRIGRAAIVVALIIVDLFPLKSIISGAAYPQAQAALEGVGSTSGGRVALMTYPEPTGLEVYFAGENADLINGWALENTPHHPALRRVLSAPAWGSEYLQNLFARWDVRTLVIAGDKEADPARATARQMGFEKQTTLGRYEIWRSASPASPVQVIPAQSMLVIGDSLSPFLSAFPFAEEVSPPEFWKNQFSRLGEYPLLGLYRFASNSSGVKTFQDRIRSYVEAGGTIVLDLSGMEDIFGRTTDIFGVHAFRLAFEDTMRIQWEDSAAGLPRELNLSGLIEQGWSGATYEGLDGVLATVESGGSPFAVWGYKNLGKGKVWFVGANLLYYAQLTNNSEIRNAIREKALEGQTLSTDAEWQALPVKAYRETATGLSFDYEAADPVSVLVSYTYSPRWRATVDGSPAGVLSRDGLIRLSLPAGSHRVEIRYQPFGTIWPVLGLLAGLLGLLLCVAGVWAEWRMSRTGGHRRDLLEVFQKPESPAGEGAYTPCAHCGFRLAESHPPTPITYPFQVSHCPICGAHMDDEGFVSGKDLSREEQARILSEWLRTNGYNARMIYTQWGFTLEEFFRHE